MTMMLTSNTLDSDPPSTTSAHVFLHLSSWQDQVASDDNDGGGEDGVLLEMVIWRKKVQIFMIKILGGSSDDNLARFFQTAWV